MNDIIVFAVGKSVSIFGDVYQNGLEGIITFVFLLIPLCHSKKAAVDRTC